MDESCVVLVEARWSGLRNFKCEWLLVERLKVVEIEALLRIGTEPRRKRGLKQHAPSNITSSLPRAGQDD